jgi:hypothetical protein
VRLDRGTDCHAVRPSSDRGSREKSGVEALLFSRRCEGVTILVR